MRSDGKATSSSTAATPGAQSATACKVELVAATVIHAGEECAYHHAKPNCDAKNGLEPCGTTCCCQGRPGSMA
eukprot:11850584-Alexandrium_andersonii.AAC.1